MISNHLFSPALLRTPSLSHALSRERCISRRSERATLRSARAPHTRAIFFIAGSGRRSPAGDLARARRFLLRRVREFIRLSATRTRDTYKCRYQFELCVAYIRRTNYSARRSPEIYTYIFTSFTLLCVLCGNIEREGRSSCNLSCRINRC